MNDCIACFKPTKLSHKDFRINNGMCDKCFAASVDIAKEQLEDEKQVKDRNKRITSVDKRQLTKQVHKVNRRR